MDGGVTSVIDEDTGKETYHQLSQLWESAGMHARKWLSNSHAVLEEIPVADQAPDINLSGDFPAIKSLGLKWQASHDALSFNIRAEQQESPWAKRLFLKKLASVFDSLGLLSPFIVRGKALLQSACMAGYGWDNPLDLSLSQQANAWWQ